MAKGKPNIHYPQYTRYALSQLFQRRRQQWPRPDTPPQIISKLGTQLAPAKPVISFLDTIRIEYSLDNKNTVSDVTFVGARQDQEVVHSRHSYLLHQYSARNPGSFVATRVGSRLTGTRIHQIMVHARYI